MKTLVRFLAVLAATSLVMVAAIAALESVGQPGPLTLFRFEYGNANADAPGQSVRLLWSIETYNDTLSLEGPAGATAPSGIRLVRPGADPGPILATSTLDPRIHISVCPGRRPPLGAMWWSGVVPNDMATELRSTGATSHRLEARVGAEWRPVVLLDSHCRGVGRG